ncbi:185_t:CDS:1, partial [Ambispora gerdemannii]
AESGLQIRTGAASSMFGICIIWGEYDDFLDSKLRPLRSEVKRLKEGVSKEQYKYYEEIKLLKLEQKQIEARMKENKRKAQSEKDPAKKALLLQLIEDDGKKLEENLKKQKAIPTANLKFDPDKYVEDLIEGLKKAIEKGGKSDDNGGGISGRNKNKKEESDSESEEDNNSSSNRKNGSNSRKEKKSKNKSPN